VSRRPESISELQGWLAEEAYLADRGLATAVFLSLALGQPLLVEGEAGVGKTEIAKALSACLHAELVRLQCYEGIDANQALYEWDYARQLVYLQALRHHPLPDSERAGAGTETARADHARAERAAEDSVDEVFGSRFLLERPLLHALRAGDRAVLLIDEIDRADSEFEAFLLELLSEFQVTVPEIGPIRAERPPVVVLTSNRTRELDDALRRRCLYHWIDYPDLEREVTIVRARAPEVDVALATRATEVTRRIRDLDLVKRPGVSETIEWARALNVLSAQLDLQTATDTLGVVVKDHDDDQLVRASLPALLVGDAARDAEPPAD
jgi:MoxR-like ATPase